MEEMRFGQQYFLTFQQVLQRPHPIIPYLLVTSTRCQCDDTSVAYGNLNWVMRSWQCSKPLFAGNRCTSAPRKHCSHLYHRKRSTYNGSRSLQLDFLLTFSVLRCFFLLFSRKNKSTAVADQTTEETLFLPGRRKNTMETISHGLPSREVPHVRKSPCGRLSPQGGENLASCLQFYLLIPDNTQDKTGTTQRL